MTPVDIRTRLTVETRALAQARLAVAAGTPVALDALDARVGALCRAIEALPHAEALAFLDDLREVTSTLDDLAAAVWASMRRNPGARIFPFQLGRP